MDKPQIVLPLKKGDPVTLTITDPTVNAKKTYFRNGQIFNEHQLKCTSLRLDRDAEMSKLRDPELNKTRAERDAIIDATSKLNRELEKFSEKSYDLDCRTAYDLLIPIDDGKKPKFDEIDWENANDNQLEDVKDFFEQSCKRKILQSTDSDSSSTGS